MRCNSNKLKSPEKGKRPLLGNLPKSVEGLGTLRSLRRERRRMRPVEVGKAGCTPVGDCRLICREGGAGEAASLAVGLSTTFDKDDLVCSSLHDRDKAKS